MLSRCAHRIYVGAPAYEQLLAIIKLYVNKYLVECSHAANKPPSFLRWYLNPTEVKKIKIADHALDDTVLSFSKEVSKA